MNLKISKWINGGLCIAYLDGKTVFVERAIPDETVECKEIGKKSEFILYEVTKVLEASETRVESDCPVYEKCGGCTFRHITYNSELDLKINLLKQELIHKKIIDKDEPLDIKIHSASPNNYRNNVQFKFKNNKLGFYKTDSNDIVEIPETGCNNLSIELNQIASKIKSGEIKYNGEGKYRNFDNQLYLYSKEESEFQIDKLKIKIPPNGFFQINQYLIPDWLNEISNLASGTERKALELFSGSGLISLYIANKFDSIVCYESDSNSVRYGEKNANLNQITNCKFYKKDLYKLSIDENHLNLKYWIVNPPRAGLGTLLTEKIRKHKPEKILYSSCNYITLIKDITAIKDIYKIESISIFDFFPRTPYFETLVLLSGSI
jgi:23S rRNA (uracil1939-C5)-methyltransferase